MKNGGASFSNEWIAMCGHNDRGSTRVIFHCCLHLKFATVLFSLFWFDFYER